MDEGQSAYNFLAHVVGGLAFARVRGLAVLKPPFLRGFCREKQAPSFSHYPHGFSASLSELYSRYTILLDKHANNFLSKCARETESNIRFVSDTSAINIEPLPPC